MVKRIRLLIVSLLVINSFRNWQILAEDEIVITICEQVGVLKAVRIIGYIINILKILVPIIIILKGIINLSQCVITNSDKYQEKIGLLIKRIFIGVIIFFIPTIIHAILSLVNSYKDFNANAAKCGICLSGANSSQCKSIVKTAQAKWEAELASAEESLLARRRRAGEQANNTTDDLDLYTNPPVTNNTVTTPVNNNGKVSYGYGCTSYISSSSYNSTKANAIIKKAETKLGTPYKKMDCSSFVSYVYNDYLQKSTAAGLAKLTRSKCVKLEDARPGDIFFTSHYDKNGKCQNCVGSTHGNRCNRYDCIMHTGIVAEVKNGKITKVIHSADNGVAYENKSFRYSPTTGKSWMIMITRPY